MDEGEVGHRLEDLVDHLGVERARRLVEEHDLGLHREPARYGHALLRAPGEALGVLVCLLGDADTFEEARTALADLTLGDILHLYGGELYVLGDGHVRVEVELLEDHPDLRAQGVQVGLLAADVHPVDDELSGGDLLEAVYAPEQGTLSRSRRADHDDHFALVYGEVYIFDDLELPEELVNTSKLYDAHRAPKVLGARCRIA
jgi:hypothetical protein